MTGIRALDRRAADRARRSRWRAAPGRDGRGTDRGSVSLELAILFPVVLVLIMTTIQVALYSFARSAALTAAHQGVNAQRGLGAPNGAGRTAAQTFLNRLGDPYSTFRSTVTVAGDEVTVRVQGHTESVIPFFSGFDIDQSASGPLEEFQP